MNNFLNYLVLADTNPYLSKATGILGDLKGWLLGLVAAVTLVVIVKHGLEYQAGGEGEKSEAVKGIRKDLIMGGAIFFLVWLASYIITKMSS